MPATFTVQSVSPKDGMRKVLLTLIHEGKPNYIQVDVSPDVLAIIFGEDVREGDTRAISAPLVARAGSNGMRPSPLSEKT